MLRKSNPLTNIRVTLAIALAISAGAACAQEQVTAPVKALGLDSPYLDTSKLKPEDLNAAKSSAESMVKDILTSYETLRTPEMEKEILQTKRKFDDIADEGLAGERKKILDFLGLDPQADTGLYYFVTWSMPRELLRSYVIEAMWSGGTVVFKGVPPGQDLGKFIANDLRQLVYGKGAAANLSIDPRLFDAYAIKTVPAIVFTTVRNNMQCQGVNPVSVQVGSVTASYDTCPELDPSDYWKITGAVTTSYALETFIDNGAEGAKPYLRALSKGFQLGEKPAKEQIPFSGKWEDAISPTELQAAQEAAGLMTKPANSAP